MKYKLLIKINPELNYSQVMPATSSLTLYDKVSISKKTDIFYYLLVRCNKL